METESKQFSSAKKLHRDLDGVRKKLVGMTNLDWEDLDA